MDRQWLPRTDRGGSRWIGVIALGLATSSVACDRIPERAHAIDRAHSKRYVVCGIDRSGSFQNLLETGKQVCAETIRKAGPGDEIVLRWISEASYLADQNFIAHYVIPAGGGCGDNPFDEACAAEERAVEAAKQATAQEIRRLQAPRASKTDIYGFFQKASDVLRHVPPDAERVIIVASDLVDNVRFRVAPGHLDGIQIEVHGFEPSADPYEVSQARDAWTQYFNENGAASVSFPSVEAQWR